MLKIPLWIDQFSKPNNLGISDNPNPDTDIAIIGSGYTGLCAARVLRKHGASVTVFDRNTIGWGASSRNGGMATPGLKQGIKKVALTYVNNDYGVGLANSFKASYEKSGGKITSESKHEDKKASYRSELATLSKGGPEALVIIAYADASGQTIIRQSLENQFFDRFELVLRQILKEDSQNLKTQPGISSQLIITTLEGNIGRYIRSKFKDSPSSYIENIWEMLAISIFKN